MFLVYNCEAVFDSTFVTIIDKLNDFVSRNASFFLKIKQLHYELELKYNVQVNNKKKLPNKLESP